VTALDRNRFVGGNCVRDAASIAGRRNDDDIVLAGQRFDECFNAGRIDAVVVSDQNAQAFYAGTKRSASPSMQ
jgi:hypothetical protein